MRNKFPNNYYHISQVALRFDTIVHHAIFRFIYLSGATNIEAKQNGYLINGSSFHCTVTSDLASCFQDLKRHLSLIDGFSEHEGGPDTRPGRQNVLYICFGTIWTTIERVSYFSYTRRHDTRCNCFIVVSRTATP